MINLRDISTANSRIKSASFFRSAQYNDLELCQLITLTSIRTIIDMRTEEEIDTSCSYSQLGVEYICVPIEYESARNKYFGTPMESVYQYFARDCKSQIIATLKEVMKAPIPLLIHCRHGIDRTGIITAILLLLCNTSREAILGDYMKSGNGVVARHLEIFLNIINDNYGIEKYLTYDQFTISDIKDLQVKLLA